MGDKINIQCTRTHTCTRVCTVQVLAYMCVHIHAYAHAYVCARALHKSTRVHTLKSKLNGQAAGWIQPSSTVCCVTSGLSAEPQAGSSRGSRCNL